MTAANAIKGKDFKSVELVLQNAAGEKIEYVDLANKMDKHLLI